MIGSSGGHPAHRTIDPLERTPPPRTFHRRPRPRARVATIDRGDKVTFWNWRRGPGPSATHGTSALASSPELAPIEIYTADSRIVGWIAPDGQPRHRPAQLADELRLWRPSSERTDEIGMPAPERRSAASLAQWEGLTTARVVLAMPPGVARQPPAAAASAIAPRSARRGAVQHHRQRSLANGVQVGTHLLRGQGFLPLTDAYFLRNGEPSFEHVVSVVIVNTRPRLPDRSARHPGLRARHNRRRWPSSAARSISTMTTHPRQRRRRWRALVDDLRARTDALTHDGAGGDERSIARHRERGKLPVRERIDRLIDPGSAFLELIAPSRRPTSTTTRRPGPGS